jgi:hypothetical protein
MLVRRDGETVLAIGQLSHSWLSGQLARAWGNERFPAPQPREAVALGAEQHDVGWAMFDLQPGLNVQSGLPRSFLELSVQEHLTIWSTAPDRLLTSSAHAALVVSLHGSSLSQLRLRTAEHDRDELQRHVETEGERQAQLRRMLGLSELQAARLQRQMWTWDGLSLALCNAWDPFTARDVPTHDGLVDLELRRTAGATAGDHVTELTLAPWPLSEPLVELRCEAKRIAARHDDEQTLHRALAEAERVTLRFQLTSA